MPTSNCKNKLDNETQVLQEGGRDGKKARGSTNDVLKSGAMMQTTKRKYGKNGLGIMVPTLGKGKKEKQTSGRKKHLKKKKKTKTLLRQEKTYNGGTNIWAQSNRPETKAGD